MIVMKFGGTSVKDASAMQKSLAIVRERLEHKPLVVLSACGGITDKLLNAARLSAQNSSREARELLDAIEAHHHRVCSDLLPEGEYYALAIEKTNALLSELRTFCEGIALLGECTPRSLDAVAAIGERLSTTIFSVAALAAGIKTTWFDARTVMRTNNAYTKAVVNTAALRTGAREHILPHIEQGALLVTQGFIGSTDDGITTTIGRGGGDLSAALFGAALDVEEIQIWTDVSGILSADPRIIPNALSLAEMSFAEVRQLAYYGAKVLHPDTIKPAVEKDIPVKVLNTFAPEHPGTIILHHSQDDSRGIRAVTLKNDCRLLQMETSAHKNTAVAALLGSAMAEASAREIDILATYAGESSCAFVVHQNDAEYFARVDSGFPVSLLCACGPNMRQGKEQVLTMIAAALEPYKPIALLWGITDVSFLALLSPEVARQALAAVHAIIERGKQGA